MPTTYPTALDALTNPTANDSLNSPTVPHATQHANANDAIAALQHTIGITGSADQSSIQYRLGNVETTRANLASPTFTGVPRVPTAQILDSTTQIASTEFVASAVSGRLIDARFIAHRGGSLMNPENTLSAFSWAMKSGCREIEFDCQLTGDGEIGVMHDTTIDRTTTSSGNVSQQSTSGWKALTINSSALMGHGTWPAESPPLFREVLDLLMAFPWVRIWPEGKTSNTVPAIVSELRRYNIPRYRAVIQVDALADVSVVADGGYECAYNVDPATVNFSTLYAAGVRYLIWPAFTSQQLSGMHAAGIKACIYGVERRADIATQIANGVDFFIVDDPLWASGATTPRTTSAWQRSRYEPGYFWNGVIGYLPQIFGDYSIGWSSNLMVLRSQLQGWACPIKGSETCNSFTISFQVEFTAVSADDRWGSLFICSTTDRLWEDTGVNTKISGYHVLFRRNGAVGIYKQALGQSASSLGTQSGSTLQLSVYYPVVVTVTPTQVSVNLNAQGALTVSDATFRGGYFHIACNGAAIRFKSMVIT